MSTNSMFMYYNPRGYATSAEPVAEVTHCKPDNYSANHRIRWLTEQAFPVGTKLFAASVAQEPVARLHITPTDTYPDIEIEVLDGSTLQPSMSPVLVYAAPVAAQPTDQDFKGLLAAIRYELGLVGTDGETILSIGARRTLRWADAQISKALDSDTDAAIPKGFDTYES